MTTLALKYPHVFGPRWPEWTGGLSAVLAGMGILHPYPAFDTPAFTMMGTYGENILGAVLLVVGIVRLIGLYINGRKKKITPWIRVGAAFVCWIIWTWLSFQFFRSGAFSVWVGAWPVFALTEFTNMYRGAHDARIGHG